MLCRIPFGEIINDCPFPEITLWEVEVRTKDGTVVATFQTPNGEGTAFALTNTTAEDYASCFSGTFLMDVFVDRECLAEDVDVCHRVTNFCGTSAWACDEVKAQPALPAASVSADNSNLTESNGGTVDLCYGAWKDLPDSMIPLDPGVGDKINLVIPELGIDVELPISGDICTAFTNDIGTSTWASLCPFITGTTNATPALWMSSGMCFTFDKKSWWESQPGYNADYSDPADIAYNPLEQTHELTTTCGPTGVTATDSDLVLTACYFDNYENLYIGGESFQWSILGYTNGWAGGTPLTGVDVCHTGSTLGQLENLSTTTALVCGPSNDNGAITINGPRSNNEMDYRTGETPSMVGFPDNVLVSQYNHVVADPTYVYIRQEFVFNSDNQDGTCTLELCAQGAPMNRAGYLVNFTGALQGQTFSEISITSFPSSVSWDQSANHSSNIVVTGGSSVFNEVDNAAYAMGTPICSGGITLPPGYYYVAHQVKAGTDASGEEYNLWTGSGMAILSY